MQVWELLNIDYTAFREWVSAERSRLPGSSDGFAQVLAVLRMLRPVEVVWVSDDREPEQCGYSSSSVGRLILEILPVGSRLVWSRVDGDSGMVRREFGGSGLAAPSSSLCVICVPENYELSLFGLGGALLVRRSVREWAFSLVHGDNSSTISGDDSGTASGDSSYLSSSEEVPSGHVDGGHSVVEGVDEFGGDGDGGDQPVHSEDKPSVKRRKVRRSGGD